MDSRDSRESEGRGAAGQPRRFGMTQADKQRLLQAMKGKGGQGAPEPPRGRTASRSVSADLLRFDTLPSYREIEIQRAVARKTGVEDGCYLCHEACAGRYATLNGRRLLNFATYDYLGLNADPRLQEAAAQAAARFGMSASASRITAGERPPHRELELLLAGLCEAEDCICYVSGHGANVSTLGCLFGPRDAVFCDALCHNSLVLGVQLSGARRFVYPSGDMDALARLLEEHRPSCQRAVIVTEGLFGMDGCLCDLPRLAELKREHGCLLMVDEAHSMGVCGPTGRGVREHFGLASDAADIWMGTLSKSFCGCGGYIAGSRTLVDLLKYSAPGFVYSVGMPPAMAAASAEAVRLMLAEPWRVAKLQANGARFLQLAKARGLDTGLAEGLAVVPVMIGDSLATVAAAQLLRERGILLNAAFYPGVEEGKARLRLFMSANHEEGDLEAAADAIAEAVPEGRKRVSRYAR